ncbi:MAG: hypothetical protein J7500_05375 [Sphingomonas sp.]|uniref:hypothetical protein n=1 Tax=Sphingomonas sp. TaxID=28214 RepID=UPI001B174F42|nr:hypothetical protein [Sphingomonas sp.]MBO9622125.1 hypothetical protein [Sphingomonas sp.]
MKHAILGTLFAGALLAAAPALAQGWNPAPPPGGASPNQPIPARDAAGNYLTPNSHLTPEEASWHVRAALNVAALGCRDADEDWTVAAYNRLLARQRGALAAADAAVKAQYRQRYGAGWESQHDREMTRVYNFFAQPPAQQRFCAAAREALAQVDTVEPQDFERFAADALPRLEAPFTDFYRAFEAWRMASSAPPATLLASVPVSQSVLPSLP